MTTPQDGRTAEQLRVAPTVSTAPARSRWSKLPAHLGRARTSTVILGVLFLGLGLLYLEIRPHAPGDQGTVRTGEQAPAPATAPAAPTTPPPTTEAPGTTTEVPTTTEEFTTTPSEPTETTATPSGTGVETDPSPTGPTSAGQTSAPTAVDPPG